MKKILSVVIVFVLCLGLLSGCGKAKEDDPPVIKLTYGDSSVEVTTSEWNKKAIQLTTDDAALSKSCEYVGVKLADLMEIAGAADCSSINVKASDGYTTEISAEDAKNYPILIANSFGDGKPIDAGSGGPVKLVFPITDYPELSNTYDMWSWQWYTVEVEFVR